MENEIQVETDKLKTMQAVRQELHLILQGGVRNPSVHSVQYMKLSQHLSRGAMSLVALHITGHRVANMVD